MLFCIFNVLFGKFNINEQTFVGECHKPTSNSSSTTVKFPGEKSSKILTCVKHEAYRYAYTVQIYIYRTDMLYRTDMHRHEKMNNVSCNESNAVYEFSIRRQD